MIRTKVFGVNSSPKQRKGTRPRIHFLNIPELLPGSLKLVSASQLPNENDPSHSPFTRRVRKKLDFPLSLKATGLWRIFTQDNSPKEIFFSLSWGRERNSRKRKIATWPWKFPFGAHVTGALRGNAPNFQHRPLSRLTTRIFSEWIWIFSFFARCLA